MARPRVLRGINLVGMEGGYGVDSHSPPKGSWDRAHGPVRETNYPLFEAGLLDYYRSKGIGIVRFLFSWDRMQSDPWATSLPDPAAGNGYHDYFQDFEHTVDALTDRGIVVIMEPWQVSNDSRSGAPTWLGKLLPPTGDINIFAFARFWKLLAQRFAGNPLVEYGLVNEPHGMSTMGWWTIAQKCVDAIRDGGARSTIHVPGNGYSAASTWTDPRVDADSAQRSNAYGWLNVNGPNRPLFDPLGNSVAEVHVYMDDDGSGTHETVVSATVASERLRVAVNEAATHQYRVFVGEIAVYAGAANAHQAWADFVAYTEGNRSTCAGYAWFAGGQPKWWSDVKPPHFSVSPPAGGGDTTNMQMIEGDFASS
jgi:endoglucanase